MQIGSNPFRRTSRITSKSYLWEYKSLWALKGIEKLVVYVWVRVLTEQAYCHQLTDNFPASFSFPFLASPAAQQMSPQR